ncbi:Uncharacterised protein [Mycobacteroides abscessus subsp. abscessus]|nr:Uncharacterised protein [Mycobacteroides abscessus subsp. abscessus]
MPGLHASDRAKAAGSGSPVHQRFWSCAPEPTSTVRAPGLIYGDISAKSRCGPTRLVIIVASKPSAVLPARCPG